MTPARRIAYAAALRIDHEGAYANLVLPGVLGESRLDQRDRNFVTEMVYGVTRMRRACDHLIDRFIVREPDPEIRTLLRLGAYQLHFMETPAHAAVSETVSLAPAKTRGFVNAVLRKVATTAVVWPDEATRLSYPDWIVKRLSRELGHDDALLALATMNTPGIRTERDDGYSQNSSSEAVADYVGAIAGDLVLDVCAAPGGKATAMARSGARVVAADLQAHRVRLIADNVRELGASVAPVVADGLVPPWRAGAFDRVLIDAPCSGLGALRRRPDARWRIAESDVATLAALQRRLLAATVDVVKPGGVLVYSVCTLTAAESIDLDLPFDAIEPPGAPWRPYGRGARLLPFDQDSDGMTVLAWRMPESRR